MKKNDLDFLTQCKLGLIDLSSEEVQMEAVKQDGDSIKYIKNPSEAVKKYILSLLED